MNMIYHAHAQRVFISCLATSQGSKMNDYSIMVYIVQTKSAIAAVIHVLFNSYHKN